MPPPTTTGQSLRYRLCLADKVHEWLDLLWA